jgi:hypothetical protein
MDSSCRGTSDQRMQLMQYIVQEGMKPIVIVRHFLLLSYQPLFLNADESTVFDEKKAQQTATTNS